MINATFRSYASTDYQACLAIFDANCPEFFAANERGDYAKFLSTSQDGYEVCVVAGHVSGAFGLLKDGEKTKRLNWILLDPPMQGLGIGSEIMKRVIHLGSNSDTKIIKIAASHKSAPFFAKFGATPIGFTENGWGPQMHRVDMVLSL